MIIAGKRERGAGDVRGGPTHALRNDERQRAGRRRSDAPAVLGHARTDAELAGLQRLDAVGVDHDVVGGARDADEDRRDDGRADARRGIDEREVHDGRDHGDAREQQPGDPLAEAAEHRDPHAVHDPGPEHLEVVGEQREREGGDRALVDAVLREPGRQRRRDHRVRESRREPDEEGGERFPLDVGRSIPRTPPVDALLTACSPS